MSRFARIPVAEGLHQLNDDNQNHDGDKNDNGIKLLITVADGKIAYAASSNGSGRIAFPDS